jgi:hypothetical protein
MRNVEIPQFHSTSIHHHIIVSFFLFFIQFPPEVQVQTRDNAAVYHAHPYMNLRPLRPDMAPATVASRTIALRHLRPAPAAFNDFSVPRKFRPKAISVRVPKVNIYGTGNIH